MKFAYYPGCSARSTCAELNVATHRVAARLGLELLQLESATCTGARELRAIDPVGFYTLNVRILALAEAQGLPLMTICNTCTLNVLDAHAAFVSDGDLAADAGRRPGHEDASAFERERRGSHSSSSGGITTSLARRMQLPQDSPMPKPDSSSVFSPCAMGSRSRAVMVRGTEAELVLPKSNSVDGIFSGASCIFLRMVSLIIRFAWCSTK